VDLGSTQPLTGMSTRNISGGKDGRCVGLTTLPPSCAHCLEILEPQPPGTFRACSGLQWNSLIIFILLQHMFIRTVTIGKTTRALPVLIANQFVLYVYWKTVAYYEIHKSYINALRGHIGEFLNLKPNGT